MTPTDRILALGVALEKGRTTSLIIPIPSQPGYALYRQHGLQVIPNEAFELDTGGRDTLVVTPRADIVSGVLLQATSALPFPNASTGPRDFTNMAGGILQRAERLRKPMWEVDALSEVIAHALEIANRLKDGPGQKNTHTAPRDPTTPKPRPPGIPPHVRLNNGDDADDLFFGTDNHPLSFDPPSRRGLRDILGRRKEEPPLILVVCGVAGKVLGNLWLPMPCRRVRLSQKLIDRISIKLGKHGVDSSYAQLILGEMLAGGPTLRRR